MQKPSRETDDRHAPRGWLSTARWAMRSAPLTGRFFSAKASESPQADETIVESFDEPVEGTLREDNQSSPQSSPAALMDSPETLGTEARKAGNVRNSNRSSHERVVLFVPGPITEADLLRESVKHASTIRLRQRRRKRFRWLRDNVGTIVFVIGLLVLTWFVAAS